MAIHIYLYFGMEIKKTTAFRKTEYLCIGVHRDFIINDLLDEDVRGRNEIHTTGD